MTAQETLRHHVTGAIERGEAIAIPAIDHRRHISLDRDDIELLHEMVQLADSERAEVLEAILDELLSAGATDFTLSVEKEA